MQIPEELIAHLSELYQGLSIIQVRTQSGGDINKAYCLKTSHGHFFAKLNVPQSLPSLFQSEAKGLNLLLGKTTFKVPQPLFFGQNKNKQWLVLEWIEFSENTSLFWEKAGVSLAQQHRNTSPQFGLDHNNYIGSLPQSNKQHHTWQDFYINERLEPLVRKARNSDMLPLQSVKAFERLYTQLNSIYPNETPALLHGDLWSGNVCNTSGDAPAVYDPSVYYGHREMDVAMTLLFGGFTNDFYTAYNATHPLEKGWEKRIEFSQLYPLLVHLNLFGEGYLNRIQGVLQQF